MPVPALMTTRFEFYDDTPGTSTARDTPVIFCCADSVHRLSGDHQLIVVDESGLLAAQRGVGKSRTGGSR
eukprot:CAMPEP_0182600228 /NCGR_PEP_ID=MMETSP1324-20130603/90878_1 /TAXON_ID=236786 /ORGANISM="Florenciella sp., Strain RCC1587" /LENGTH=69 /DNA_ID=CAMNT_0024818137 /DNA_START=211 /DNA_END=420 /DNA_ORIENTATION=+